MGLYDRTYMQSDGRGAAGSVLLWLLGANGLAFVLQEVVSVWFGGQPFLLNTFALSVDSLREGKVWTLVSYGFLHAGFLHFLVNMLVIFFIGRIIESELTKRQFLAVYFSAVILGGLFFLLTQGLGQLIHEHGRPAQVVGASAGALALLIFFCARHPNERVTFLLFFIIPLTLKPKWIAWAVLAYESFGLLFRELPGASGGLNVASSAHLGGMLAGYLGHLITSGVRFRAPSFSTVMEPPAWVGRKDAIQSRVGPTRVNVEKRDDLKREVDRILDKINSQGFGALNEEEKRILDRAREVLRR